MSDAFKLQRGAAMSTLFFGHQMEDSLPRDDESEGAPKALTPVTWLPVRMREEEDADSTRY
jgi:hypothetical protein